MASTHFYEVSVDWNQDRIGSLSSPVLSEPITVATPPEFTKGVPDIWSPEHLFVAAINSCLMTTFLAIAENFKFDFIGFSSKATGKLEMIDGKYMMSEVTLMPVLTVKDDSEREKGLRILQKSEAACLITNSVKSNIIFEPEIIIATINV